MTHEEFKAKIAGNIDIAVALVPIVVAFIGVHLGDGDELGEMAVVADAYLKLIGVDYRDIVGPAEPGYHGTMKMSSERMALLEGIVRDLTRCDPMVDPDPRPSWCILCVGTDKTPDADGDRTHSPSCPFRRARELVLKRV